MVCECPHLSKDLIETDGRCPFRVCRLCGFAEVGGCNKPYIKLKSDIVLPITLRSEAEKYILECCETII
jgi:hypothetical protein